MFKKVDCKMEARTGIAIALLLVGCTQSQNWEEISRPTIVVPPSVKPQSIQRQNPQRLKLLLTLDRPEDLKVRLGEQVKTGQVISKRSQRRGSLMQERKILIQQLQQLQVQPVVPSNAQEQAEVELARLRVKLAKEAILNFHADSPWTDYAQKVLPLSERSEFGNLEAKYQEAQKKLNLSIAILKQAQQQNAVQQSQRTQKAQLLDKVRTIEEKLYTGGIVRSPYSGHIKSIKWLQQNDQELKLVLTMIVKSHAETILPD